MNRREFLVSSLAVGAVSAISQISMPESAQASGSEHKHKGSKSMRNNKKLKAIVAAANDCLKTGATCRAHCLDLISSGNTNMISCLKSVENMMAICESTMNVAAMGTLKMNTLKQVIKSCALVCDDCAKECEKHAKMHKECKSCLDPFEDCAKACRKFA